MKTEEKKLKVLITGGKGFLGKHLARGLKERGHIVESYDIADGQDLLDYTALERAVDGKDAVLHLAAVADLNYAREHPRETMDINITGTVNAADVCVKRGAALHYVSTCCVYGNQDVHPVDENTPPAPTEIYAHSKLAGEHAILGYAAHFGLKYSILRTATFYGEEMRGALAPFLFLRKAMRGEDIVVHGTGKQTRNFTYVGDVAEGISLVLDKGVTNEILNITSEEEISVLELAEDAKNISGGNSRLVFSDDRPGQIYREKVSAEKARKLLEWEAKMSFSEGLRRTHQWMKENNLHEA